MKNIKIFCFGFGQVARNFIKKLKSEKFKIELNTTSRNKTTKKKFDQINYTSFQFSEDGFDPKIKTNIE